MALTLDGTTGVSATGNLLAGGYMASQPVSLTSATGNIYVGNIIAQPSPTLTGLIVSGTGTVANLYVSSTPGTISMAGNIITSNLSVASGNITCGNIVNYNTSGVGNIGSVGVPFNQAYITAMTAHYADLAEMYSADQSYAPGTVLVHGGSKEITISTSSHATNLAGIVSSNPSYLMNNGLSADTDVKLALVGRVGCQVVGTIHKGDSLVTSDLPGVATRLDPAQYQLGCVIGKAIEEYNSDQPGVIEVAVGSF